jgi:hypothetical protein
MIILSKIRKNATNIRHYQNKQNNSISNASGIYFEQLNTIPEGYNNNLIWNIAHIIVVQQMLVYKYLDYYDDFRRDGQ